MRNEYGQRAEQLLVEHNGDFYAAMGVFMREHENELRKAAHILSEIEAQFPFKDNRDAWELVPVPLWVLQRGLTSLLMMLLFTSSPIDEIGGVPGRG